MNFKLIYKKDEVSNLRVDLDQLFYLVKEKFFKDDSIIFKGNEGELNFEIKENRLFLINNNKTIILSKKGLIINEINFPMILESINNNKAIITYDKNIRKRIFNRAYYEFDNDFKKRQELTHFNGLGKTFFTKTFFVYIRRKSFLIEVFSYLDKNEWSFDFTNINDSSKEDVENIVEKILGLYNCKLFILLNKGRLLILDSNSGAYLNLIDLNHEILLTDLVFECIHLDEEKGVLKCLAGSCYFEVNIDNLKIEVKKDFGKYEKGNWWITRSNIFGKYLTFVGSKDGVSTFPNTFGVFDTETLEVIWSDGVLLKNRENEGFFNSPPLLSDSLLVIVNSKKRMFVYEKNQQLK